MKPGSIFGALAAATLAAVLATGCASPPTPTDYADQTPRLDLAAYFDGEVNAQGLFTDRAGKVVRRFTVRMQCRWSGDDGVLDEQFVYSDGKTERRVWRLKRLHGPGNEGRFTGTADDVVGTAAGQAAGNAFQWKYTLRLPVDGSVYEVQFDDWMVLMGDGVMLNKAVMSKFGIRLGEVTLAFSKPKQ